MKIFQKLISKVIAIPLLSIDKIAYKQYFNDPLTNSPKSNLQKYYELAKSAKKNTYSIEDVDLLENDTGYSINKDWLNSLALDTQIVIKNSDLNYAHGRVLYSVLRNYLLTLNQDIRKINIIETGTARGFSTICMAKALSDSGFEGSICTFDVLPHFKKFYWNCASDHTKGKQTRHSLLIDWNDLIERYIIFIQGYTRHILPKITLPRVNFAFLDGAHTYEDVLFEFDAISSVQKKGDIIIFDDYNKKKFSGVVKAVNFIQSKKNYDISFIHNKNTSRDYVIAKKIY